MQQVLQQWFAPQQPTRVMPFDPWVLTCAATLMLIGFVMITSASLDVAERNTGTPLFYMVRQGSFMALALIGAGLMATPQRHVAIEVAAGAEELTDALGELSRAPAPSAVTLAGHMRNLIREKYHMYLSQELLQTDAAASRIRPDIVPALARELLRP